jgi:PEP-CTERM motif
LIALAPVKQDQRKPGVDPSSLYAHMWSNAMTKKRTLALAVTLALAAWASTANAASGTQIDTAIDKALGYLSGAQNAATGFWAYGGYEPAATGAAAFAMLSQQAHWGANSATYQANVDKAINYLLANATKNTVSTRNDGVNICPAAGTCSGVFWNAANNEDTYSTGLIAPAIALYGATKGASTVATMSGPLAGMTWGQIAQGITNVFAASQSTANQGVLRGGWRYTLGQPTYDSDMSTTQWAAIAMIYTQTLGATTPAIVKTDLANFLAYTQHPVTGAGCYQGPNSGLCDHADTGGLLLSLNFLGKGASDPAVQKALGFINTNWTQTANSTWYGNFGQPYAMWAVYKGLELNLGLSDTTTITNLRAGGCTTAGDPPTAPNTCNWWQDYNDWLVWNQNGNGSWNGYDYWTGNLATAFYLPILGGTEIPVPVPEPATLAVLALGLLGLAGIRRRKAD